MDWLQPGMGAIDVIGHPSVPQTATVVTAAGSTNTKGSFAELSSSAPISTSGVYLYCTARSAAAADYLVDIAIGGAAAEQVILPNVLFSSGSSASFLKSAYFPLRIPKGSRVSARAQSSTASATITLGMAVVSAEMNGLPSFDRFISFGALTATSGGTVLTAPGAAGWGAWTELEASTAEDVAWLLGIFGDNKIATRTSAQVFFGTLGAGAAAAEQQIIPASYWVSTPTTFVQSQSMGWPRWLPAGSRLSGRYGSSATTTLGCALAVYGGVI